VDRLNARTKEVEKLSQDILSKPINFDENEELILEPKLKSYPKNQEELRNEWKKFIKYNILQEIETLNAKEETQKEKKDSVNKFKLKDTIKLQILTPQQKQAKATDEVKDLLTSMFKRYDKRKKWIGFLFI
jgi:carboxyl-terminal processing protease